MTQPLKKRNEGETEKLKIKMASVRGHDNCCIKKKEKSQLKLIRPSKD